MTLNRPPLQWSIVHEENSGPYVAVIKRAKAGAFYRYSMSLGVRTDPDKAPMLNFGFLVDTSTNELKEDICGRIADISYRAQAWVVRQLRMDQLQREQARGLQ